LCSWCTAEWPLGKKVTDLVVKLTEDRPSDEEVANLVACHRFTDGPTKDCRSGHFALVMKKGEGSVLESNADWKANKKALMPKIAQQTAAMAVQWMKTYERMHTDLHPGNVSQSTARFGDCER
jgi:hypothetical protein